MLNTVKLRTGKFLKCTSCHTKVELVRYFKDGKPVFETSCACGSITLYAGCWNSNGQWLPEPHFKLFRYKSIKDLFKKLIGKY